MTDIAWSEIIRQSDSFSGMFRLVSNSAKSGKPRSDVVRGLLGVLQTDSFEDSLGRHASSEKIPEDMLSEFGKACASLREAVIALNLEIERTPGAFARARLRVASRPIAEKYEDLHGFIRSLSVRGGERVSHEELMRSIG